MDCGICLEKFNNYNKRPLVLDCGHTFCRSCILLFYTKRPVRCPLDTSVISKPFEELKVNYSLDEIIRSLSSLNVSTETMGNKTSSETIAEERQKAEGIYPGTQLQNNNLCSQPLQVMCPDRHVLDHYANIQDKNRAAGIRVGAVIHCDACDAHIIKSSWSCISCKYDMCNSCFTLKSSQYIPEPNLNNGKQIICPQQHQLKYYNDFSERKVAAGISTLNIVNCDYCKTSNIRSGWSCIICNFDLCEICSNDQFQSLPALEVPVKSCRNSHPLYFYQSTDSFYRRKLGNFSSIRCDYCSTIWNGSSWACRLCSFDICSTCINKKNELTNVKCNKDHYLLKLKDLVVKRNCDICKIFSELSYVCPNCNFYSCNSCVTYYSEAILLPLTCPLTHRLVNSDAQVVLYQRRTGNRAFACNSCRKVFNDKSYHCRRCSFDLCSSCYSSIVEGIEKGLNLLCRNRHELLWHEDTCVFYKNNYNCDLCRQTYSGCGSFHCRICRFDVCVNCSKSVIRRY